MHTFLYPTATTFINSQPSLIDQNMGKDEILEIEKIITDGAVVISGSITNFSSSVYISRTLLKFDTSAISSSVSVGDIPFPTMKLKLYSIESKNIRDTYKIECFPISGSWRNGIGKKYDAYPSNYGVSWLSRGDNFLGNWSNVGGDFYSGSSASVDIFQKQDVSIDVSNLISEFFSGSMVDDGFLLKLSDESSSVDYGTIRHFSMNTNTIYSPMLDVSWDDSQYNVVSASVLDSNVQEYLVIPKNIKRIYNVDEVVRINLAVRPKYVQKTFQKWPNQTYPYNDYVASYVLPSSSYYAVVDAVTNEHILNYDQFTKVSSTDSGSYFFIDFGCFPRERYYKIYIKVIEENQSVNIYDTGIPFRITGAS